MHLTDRYSYCTQLGGEKQSLRVSCNFAWTAAAFLLRGIFQIFFRDFCSTSYFSIAFYTHREKKGEDKTVDVL